MKVKIIMIALLFTGVLYSLEKFDLAKEYSIEYYQKGVRSFHNTDYELAISYFIKSLGYYENNNESRFFLGEAYRKAGYEKNALFVWNTLVAMGAEDKWIKNKISSLYNKRGMLTDIFIDKDFVLREDIKGFYNDKTPPLFMRPTQICIDENNHYYIGSFLTSTVVELDPNLSLVRNYISPSLKVGKPFGCAVDKSGFLYISDFENDVVLKLNKLNIIEKTIGFKGIGQGGLLGPEAILLDDDENLYVVDSGNHRINKYNTDGAILFSFGNENDSPGKLKSPAGLFYDDGKVYVCDKEENRVVVFDKSGNFIRSFGEEQLEKPYGITRDSIGRFLILCEKKLWAYEEENALWYLIDAVGNRLERGMSIATDKEGNILISDFNSSRLLILSLERQRYSNLNVNIERVYAKKFPTVHFALRIEKDDGTIPTGITNNNITIFENGKYVPEFSLIYTDEKNENNDVTIIYDRTKGTVKNAQDFKTTADKWIKNKKNTTNICFIGTNEIDPVIENDFDSTRLSILDSIENKRSYSRTDKGAAIKYGIYHMLNRFSKKSIILVTDSSQTGNDFEKFKIEDCAELARNNDIKIYVVSFGDGGLSEEYLYLTQKTGGDFYRVYRRSDLQELIQKIEKTRGNELIVSYQSKSTSRFGDEPISIYVETNYSSMKGIAKSVYFPGSLDTLK